MGEFITFSAGLLALAITILVYVRRPPRALWPSLFLFTLSVTVWAFGELFTTYLTSQQRWFSFWLTVQYTGIQAVPPIWWILSLQTAKLCGHRIRWAGWPAYYGPALVVAFFWLVMISNPIHKLFVNATVNGPIERGPLWLAFAVVAYALILGSIGVLTWLATRRLNRDHVIQVRIMLAGGALPLISNFLYVTGWIDLGFDLTVAAFSFLAVLFVFGIYRHRMFALSPISLNRVIYDEPNALIITDREGRVCFANAAAENLFWASAELVSSPIFPVMDAVFELANQRGKPPGFKAICRPDDGKPPVSSGELLRLRGTDRFFVFQKTELPTWRKRTFGFGVRLIEVTEIEYVKNRLAEHAGAMEAILDSVNEGILVVDGNGKMIFLNERFQKMWDLPEHIMDTRIAEDAITHALDQLVDPGAFMAGMQALAASPQETAERDQIHRKDGRVYERSTRPLLNGDEPVGRVCTFRDITTNLKSDPDLESSTA